MKIRKYSVAGMVIIKIVDPKLIKGGRIWGSKDGPGKIYIYK